MTVAESAGRDATRQATWTRKRLPSHQLVKNGAEQAAIRMMRQYRAGGLSLREIAGNLNLKLIPTKQNGIWQANTVRGILARA